MSLILNKPKGVPETKFRLKFLTYYKFFSFSSKVLQIFKFKFNISSRIQKCEMIYASKSRFTPAKFLFF
jgi:hypothetical protein